MSSNKKEFATSNLALAAYLYVKGLEYSGTGTTVGKNDKSMVVFKFADPLGVGKDLELDYMKSEFKLFRDSIYFFRNEIDRVDRQIQRQIMLDRQRNDEKYIDENTDEEIKEG